MHTSRCAAKCHHCHGVTRRQFVSGSASLLSASVFAGRILQPSAAKADTIAQAGPAAKYVPTVRAAFVRREGEYGMRWPGQIYDGEAARKNYSKQIHDTANELGIKLDLRAEPIYSIEEAEKWVKESTDAKPDGLLVVLLDRQRHAWPTAGLAMDSGIPTVVFSPVGTSFTTNTISIAHKPRSFIAATDDFSQVQYGMKMLAAGAKAKNTRCLVLRGDKTYDTVLPHLGTQLHYVPAQAFLDEYQKTPIDDDIKAMAAELIAGARRLTRASEQDVLNGIKSYRVARTLLEREKCDAISMDCLGALGHTKVSLPCIAWSKMNDDGIPAACEADRGAIASHILVQYLFDRPGFQQDPVPETVRDAIIGAHCSCPLNLNGFNTDPEPYDIVHHHGMRDATARPVWKIGQRVTSLDVLPGNDTTPTRLIISAGDVIENVSAPPSGGCVVSVMVKFDNVTDVLAYPGFHQLFFYGDYKKELRQFCQLFGLEAVVV